MRIVLSGGGTAGHINPALALAETLEEQGHEVFYAGTPQGVEARLVKEAGLPFKAFEASGFDRAHPGSRCPKRCAPFRRARSARKSGSPRSSLMWWSRSADMCASR